MPLKKDSKDVLKNWETVSEDSPPQARPAPRDRSSGGACGPPAAAR